MLSGKNIVLTGASSGIGLEMLKLLAQGDGNRILAVSRRTGPMSGIGGNVIPFSCDVSSPEGVEAIFAQAEQLFDKIDVLICNAGFPYYEEYNYTDWERIEKIYRTNAFSPMYTYSRYLKHLDGRPGQLGFTISAMGQMAMPGYALYTSTKFALHGFQQAVRLEMPENLKLTCLYPVATATNFFEVANDKGKIDKPFPVQTPQLVAHKMIAALERGKKSVSPCFLFRFAKLLMAHVPLSRTIYWNMETAKFQRYIRRVEESSHAV